MTLRYGGSISPRPTAHLAGWFERRTAFWPVRRWLELDGCLLSYRHRENTDVIWTCDLRECGLVPGKRAREIVLTRPSTESLSLFTITLDELKVWFAEMKKVSDSVYDFYHFSANVGHSPHGAIYLGLDKTSGRRIAILAEDKSKLPLPKSLILTKRDMTVVSATQTHESLISVVDLFESSERFYTLTELISGGTLQEALARRPLSEEAARMVMSDALRALSHLHERGVVHGHVDGLHIVCTRRQFPCRVKLAAYGSAVCARDVRLLGAEGVADAPEVVCFQRHSTKSDVFSAGVLLFRLLCGAEPFPACNEAAYLSCVSRGARFGEVEWGRVSEQARRLVVAMLADDAAERPSARECLDSLWFREALVDADAGEVSDDMFRRSASDPKTVIVNFDMKQTEKGVVSGSISQDESAAGSSTGQSVPYAELD